MNAVVVLFMFVMANVLFNIGGVLGDHEDWETCAFIQEPGNSCADEADLDILQEWGDQKLHERFNVNPEPIYTHYHPEKEAETDRRLQVCSPNYCAQFPTVCILAGCNPSRRRRLSEEDDEDDFQCADVSLGWEEILEDADEVYDMAVENIELTDGSECDTSKLWFVIYLEGND